MATALIQLLNEAYHLILSSDLIDDLTNHLSRYILRSKVILSKNEINAFGIYKKDTVAIVDSDNHSLRSLFNDDQRFVLLSNEYQGQDSIDEKNWLLEDIRSGIPIINKINSISSLNPNMIICFYKIRYIV